MSLLSENKFNFLKKFTLVDVIIVLAFALFASLYQINRVAGNNFFQFYASDSESIACFAAAIDHPELFKEDEVLANPDNFSFYSTLDIPFIRAITKLTKNYASGYLSLVGLLIFLQAFGFYLLGRALFQNRYWAALLAVVTLVHVPLALGDFWGMYQDPLPRITFQTALPYILTAVFYWRFKPAMSLLLLGITGLCMYLHFGSVPTWGLSIWLGLRLFLPASWGLRKRIGFMFLAGIIFLLGSLPFLINYFDKTHSQSPIDDINLISAILRYRLPDVFFDISLSFTKFISNLTFLRVSLFGIVSAIYVFLRYRDERKKIGLIGLWILGILITAVIIPFILQLNIKVLTQNGTLIRNLRYLFPLMLIFCLWPFVVISRDSPSKRNRKIALIAGFILVLGWSSKQMYKHIVYLNDKGYLLPNAAKTRNDEIIDVLNAVKQITPAGSKILSLASFSDLTIRYYALRPLVYSFKDAASFSFSNNHAELIKWYEKAKEANNVVKYKQDDISKINKILSLARRFKAEYLIINRSQFLDSFISSSPDILYRNDLYVLIKIDNDPDKNRLKQNWREDNERL